MRVADMMLSVHGGPLVLQAGLPLVLLAWQARGRDLTILGWVIKTTVVALYLAAAAVSGLWLVIPWPAGWGFLIVSATLALWKLRRVRRLPWRSSHPSWISIGIRTALATAAVLALVSAGGGRRIPPGRAVDLEFPLRGGTYYVANGGSVALLNAHVLTLAAEQFRAYRGQSYGVDLIKLDRVGTRGSGLLPDEPARYAIYGERVYAPCSGVVVEAVDGFPDMPPPQPDRTQMAGNHVLLDCGGVQVLLGHFQAGSVLVRAREPVAAGTIVGLVGNSGNSNEPHLHIHAQRAAPAGQPPLSGDPLPMRFGGRFLVRNDRVRSTLP